MAAVPGSYVQPSGGSDSYFERRSNHSYSDEADTDTDAAKNVSDPVRTPFPGLALVYTRGSRHVTDHQAQPWVPHTNIDCLAWVAFWLHSEPKGAAYGLAQAALQEIRKAQKPHRMAVVPVDEEDDEEGGEQYRAVHSAERSVCVIFAALRCLKAAHPQCFVSIDRVVDWRRS